MKCPSCEDAEKQECLGVVPEQPTQATYRCSRCGRLYTVNVDRAASSVRLVRSGTSNLLTLEDHPAATELRQWIKDQDCRVGPVFEPTGGRFAFFVYISKDRTVDLIGRHGGFRIEND